jgi:hypothetical protein
MSLEADYLKWRHQPHVGCVFARLIAGRPADFEQKIERVPSAGPPRRTAGNIARRVNKRVADRNVVAGVLLLPDLVTLEALTKVALALGELPRWTVTTTALENPRAGEMVAVHIVREIPFGDGTCPSEALVLGPFPEFPATRRAPITALELYVGEPRPNDPKTGNPTVKANLAHMELNLETHAAFVSMWDKSVESRLRSLGGGEDSRAKAKVSFVIPTGLARELGCAP